MVDISDRKKYWDVLFSNPKRVTDKQKEDYINYQYELVDHTIEDLYLLEFKMLIDIFAPGKEMDGASNNSLCSFFRQYIFSPKDIYSLYIFAWNSNLLRTMGDFDNHCDFVIDINMTKDFRSTKSNKYIPFSKIKKRVSLSRFLIDFNSIEEEDDD